MIVLITLPHESWPVANGCGHVPAVDVVVRLDVHPVLFDVVYEELDVWRGPICA